MHNHWFMYQYYQLTNKRRTNPNKGKSLGVTPNLNVWIEWNNLQCFCPFWFCATRWWSLAVRTNITIWVPFRSPASNNRWLTWTPPFGGPAHPGRYCYASGNHRGGKQMPPGLYALDWPWACPPGYCLHTHTHHAQWNEMKFTKHKTSESCEWINPYQTWWPDKPGRCPCSVGQTSPDPAHTHTHTIH